MPKLIQAVCVALLLSILAGQVFVQTSPTTSPRSSPKIGYVEDGIIGCGCALALNAADLRNHRYVYIQGMDEPAYINLDGKNVELEPVDSSNKINIPEKIGDRSWETYVAGDVKVRIDWTVTRVCDPKDESCEVTYFKAILTVSRKGQRTIVRTIGHCGC